MYSFNYKIIVIIIRKEENTFKIVFKFYIQNTPVLVMEVSAELCDHRSMSVTIHHTQKRYHDHDDDHYR